MNRSCAPAIPALLACRNYLVPVSDAEGFNYSIGEQRNLLALRKVGNGLLVLLADGCDFYEYPKRVRFKAKWY